MSDKKLNILFIVIDQLRADCVSGALADHLDLPNIRALADDAVSFHAHYSVTAPCGPSRVSMLTGQYTSNHGATRNGTPLRQGTPTLATVARKGGSEPLLVGYTDTAHVPGALDGGAAPAAMEVVEVSDVRAAIREVERRGATSEVGSP